MLSTMVEVLIEPDGDAARRQSDVEAAQARADLDVEWHVVGVGAGVLDGAAAGPPGRARRGWCRRGE